MVSHPALSALKRGTYKPVQCSVNVSEITLLGVEIRRPEDRDTCSRSQSIQVQAISSKGGSKDLVVNLQLSWLAPVLADHSTNVTGTTFGAIPIKIEGDEYFHVIASGRRIGISKLRICIAIDSNVQREGIDPKRLGPLHIVVIVRSTCTITNNANLVDLLVLYNLIRGFPFTLTMKWQNTSLSVAALSFRVWASEAGAAKASEAATSHIAEKRMILGRLSTRVTYVITSED